MTLVRQLLAAFATFAAGALCLAIGWAWRRPARYQARFFGRDSSVVKTTDSIQAGPIGQAGQALWLVFGGLFILGGVVNLVALAVSVVVKAFDTDAGSGARALAVLVVAASVAGAFTAWRLVALRRNKRRG